MNKSIASIYFLLVVVLVIAGCGEEKKQEEEQNPDYYYKTYAYTDQSDSCGIRYYIIDEIITESRNSTGDRHASQYICVSVDHHDTMRIFDPTVHSPFHIEDSVFCHNIPDHIDDVDSVDVVTSDSFEEKYGHYPYFFSQLIAEWVPSRAPLR